MKIDYVRALCNWYEELTACFKFFETKTLLQQGYCSPIKKSVDPTGTLWVIIMPNIHNPIGKFTRSASLRVYDPSGQFSSHSGRMYLELQAFDSDDQNLPNGIQLFLRIPDFGDDLAKIEICRTIVTNIRHNNLSLHADG
ncbi:MAG: hypothetical protein AAB470_01755 [Patescibacteria group bacterium]